MTHPIDQTLSAHAAHAAHAARAAQNVFTQIKTIDPLQQSSWQGKIFLTFDLDWAPDYVLAHVLDILEHRTIKATLFVTHRTPLLERMRANPHLELGIHPNFNPLLYGKPSMASDIPGVVDYFLDIVPEALSVRSHSLVQSSGVMETYHQKGIKFDCNHFIPYQSGLNMKPWPHWFKGLTKVPFCWEDDIHILYDRQMSPQWVSDLTAAPGLKVLNFHPVHVYLNSAVLDNYHNYRNRQPKTETEAQQFVNKEYGTRNFLLDVIAANGD